MNDKQIKEFKDSVKRIFSGYTVWTSKMEKELLDLGFEIEDNRKKHVILKYKYKGHISTFSISKTPSDSRAGLNNASIIYRTIFLR